MHVYNIKKILPSYSTSDALIALHQTEDYMATLTSLLIVHFNTVSTDTSFCCVISLCSTTAITSHQCTDDLKQNKESIVHVTSYFGMFQVSCCWVLWRYFWWCDHPQMLLLGTMKIFVVMPLYSVPQQTDKIRIKVLEIQTFSFHSRGFINIYHA